MAKKDFHEKKFEDFSLRYSDWKTYERDYKFGQVFEPPKVVKRT